VSGVSSSDSDPDDDDELEEDVEAARLFRFRLRFLAGAFATAGDIAWKCRIVEGKTS
jgi:hypothetical protein